MLSSGSRAGSASTQSRDPGDDGQECAPGLRRRCTVLRHQPGDGALGHIEAKLEKLAVDSGGTPQGIGRGHFPDQGGDLGVDGWAAPGGPAGELSPVLPEAAPLPPQNGSRGYDDEGLPPPGPDPDQPDPEEAIRRAKLGGARPCSRGQVGDGRRRGTGGVEAGGARG